MNRKAFILKYGIIGGLISSLLGTLNWILVAHTIGVAGSQAIGYLSISLSLLCIPLGIKYYRDQISNASISFGDKFKVGLGITLVAGIVMAIHSMIFFILQKDEFLAWQRSELTSLELQEFNDQLAQMPEYAFTPWFQGCIMFIMVLLIGLVINVISAAVINKES